MMRKPSHGIVLPLLILIGASGWLVGHQRLVELRTTTEQQDPTATRQEPTTLQPAWVRARAGAWPGLHADLAILHTFDADDRARACPDGNAACRSAALNRIRQQLELAMLLDPSFRDTARLIEGLLGYEPGYVADAVHLIARHADALQWGEPLLIAAFLAHQELGQDRLAMHLAVQAMQDDDIASLAISFAKRLAQGGIRCHQALAFLRTRLRALPPARRHALKQRIRSLQAECVPSADQHHLPVGG